MGQFKKIKKHGTNRFAAALAAIIFALSLNISVLSEAAVSWPYPGGNIQAESAVVMDAETLTVLWGRNQDEQHYPASITKMMTALVVAEHCSLDEKVPITANAVYNLEAGATTAGLSPDDILTVEDLLYALLLKSANDAANALAIYVAGSISDFAVMMNERASELGCKNTDFKNPSGLTDSEHLTSAYDMALIAAEFIKNDTLLEIEGHDSYKLPATKKNPSGLTVTMGHKMLRSGTAYSDDRVIAGKTGFTTASGNTLVTAAREGDRSVIVVCMKDKTPYHYTDTKTLMEFGFNSFENAVLDDPVALFDCERRLAADKICAGNSVHIVADGDLTVTLPRGADTSELKAGYDYNIGVDAPDMAKARLKLYYEDRYVGGAWLLNDAESSLEFEGVSDADSKSGAVSIAVIIVIIIGMLILGAAFFLFSAYKREVERRRRFRERQKRRLHSMGVSQDEFEKLLDKKKDSDKERTVESERKVRSRGKEHAAGRRPRRDEKSRHNN